MTILKKLECNIRNQLKIKIFLIYRNPYIHEEKNFRNLDLQAFLFLIYFI